MIDKIRAGVPAGELTLRDMDGFADQPIACGWAIPRYGNRCDQNDVVVAVASAKKWVNTTLFKS